MEQEQAEALYDKHAAESTDDKSEEQTDETQGDNNDSTGAEDTDDVAVEGDSDDDAEDGADDGSDDADSDASDDEVAKADDEVEQEPVELQPREQFIYENLHAITVNGTVDGKPKELSIRLAQELPDNFEFASKREEKMFDQSLAEQAVLADRLNGKWQSDQATQQTQAQQAEQAKSIKTDIEALQKERLLPKFDKLKADTDPKAEATREVLKFYNQRRDAGSNITFRDAFELLEAKKIREGSKAKQSAAVTRRNETSAKVGNAKGEVKEAAESRWRPGMRVDDVTSAYAQDFED